MTRPPRLRVAFDVLPLAGERTGVGRFCGGLAGALARRDGLDLVPYAIARRARSAVCGPAMELGLARVRARAVPTSVFNAALRWVELPPIEWVTGPVAVVHGTNFVVPPARRAARVVTVHDLTPLRFPELCTKASLAYPRLVRRAAGRGAFVHTPSEFVADEVAERLGVDRSRIRVVPHGIALPPSDVPPAERSGTQRRYVLALGTIEPRKDFPSLVRAFGRIAQADPELRLVIAGPDGWGTDEFAAAAAASAVSERIVRVGYLEERDRQALIARAAVLAYPSLYEGFGFPPLEAMAAGVPVVAAAAGAVPEIVGDAALLVPPGDVVALAGALESVLTHDTRRDALVAAGHVRVARFTWSACGDGLEALYRDAAAEVARR